MSTYRILECEQRTPEWYQARAGRVTSSVAEAITATLKSGGEPASRRDLRTQLAIERLTGTAYDGDNYVSKEMQRGIDLEPAAFQEYEIATGYLPRKVGFVQHATLAIGTSPDGLVLTGGDHILGVLELKCPKSATHVGYLKAGRLPPEYVPQATHHLLVTGAAWVDFASFDDRLPEGLRWFHVRVKREELDTVGYANKLLAFLEEVDAEVEALRRLRKAA